jgi:hypothetical protein
LASVFSVGILFPRERHALPVVDSFLKHVSSSGAWEHRFLERQSEGGVRPSVVHIDSYRLLRHDHLKGSTPESACQVRKQATMIVLTLSSEIRNTVITNRQGTVVYKTKTPEPTFDWLGTTTIYKPKPNADQYDTSDQFEVMGEIEWHIFRPTKFRFGGNEVEAKRFIERRGLMGR